MALRDLLKLLDKNPEEAWKKAGRSERKAADPTAKRRAKLIEGIKNAIAQLEAGEESPRRGWYKKKGDTIKFALKAGNKIVPLNGKEFNTVSAPLGVEAYKAALKAAEAGELDGAMNATYEGGGSSAPRAGGAKRAGWSPERRAAHAAAQAAKKK